MYRSNRYNGHPEVLVRYTAAIPRENRSNATNHHDQLWDLLIRQMESRSFTVIRKRRGIPPVHGWEEGRRDPPRGSSLTVSTPPPCRYKQSRMQTRRWSCGGQCQSNALSATSRPSFSTRRSSSSCGRPITSSIEHARNASAVNTVAMKIMPSTMQPRTSRSNSFSTGMAPREVWA